MISFIISMVPPKLDWTRLSCQAHNCGEQRTGCWEEPAGTPDGRLAMLSPARPHLACQGK